MAISNLITAPPPIKKPMRKYDAQNAALLFVNKMNENEKMKFKTMMENGVVCGKSVAKAYNIPHELFIKEVKKLLWMMFRTLLLL